MAPPPGDLSRRRRPVAITGAWRYRATPRSLTTLWAAMAFSAAFHAAVFFGIKEHKEPPKSVVVDDVIAVTLVMPNLKELEEPEQATTDEEPPADAGLSVPTLADVPTQVDLSTAFVQQIDYSTLVPQQELNAAATISIPTHISHGTKLGEGLGKIFDLKDLDRAPEALVRIPPTVPVSLRQAGMHAEVAVMFVVDANGVVRNPEILRSSDHRFEEAAMVAISKWKFRPGIRNGRRVNVRMLQPLVFEVNEAE